MVPLLLRCYQGLEMRPPSAEEVLSAAGDEARRSHDVVDWYVVRFDRNTAFDDLLVKTDGQ